MCSRNLVTSMMGIVVFCPAYRQRAILPFQFVCVFFFFMAFTSTSSTMLNSIGENEHPCLLSAPRESILLFTTKFYIGARILTEAFNQVEEVPVTHALKAFVLSEC